MAVLPFVNVNVNVLNVNVLKGSDGNIIRIKIKKTAAMKELMTEYLEKTKVNPLYAKFLYDGQCINPKDTPDGLRLVDGDQIEVFSEQDHEQEKCLKLKVIIL